MFRTSQATTHWHVHEHNMRHIFSWKTYFEGEFFYSGQPEQTKNCSNCLETGHHASQCTKEVKCKICKQFGHKSVSCQSNVNTELRNNRADEVINARRNAAGLHRDTEPDKHEHGNNSESQEQGTAGHASSNPSGHCSDDVSVRQRTPRQPDISYFLRAKSAASPNRGTERVNVREKVHTQARDNLHDGEREQTQRESEDSNTLSSDDCSSEEEQPVTKQKEKTHSTKRKQRKKSEKRRGNTRK